jgi:hypothetical protein
VAACRGAIPELVSDALVRAGIPATELILEFAGPGLLKISSPCEVIGAILSPSGRQQRVATALTAPNRNHRPTAARSPIGGRALNGG